jgi:hypothetical protein
MEPHSVVIKYSKSHPDLSKFCWIGRENTHLRPGDIIPNSSIVPYISVLRVKIFPYQCDRLADIFESILRRKMRYYRLEQGPKDNNKNMYIIPVSLDDIWKSAERELEKMFENSDDEQDESMVDEPYIISSDDENEDSNGSIMEDTDEEYDSDDSFIVPDDVIY